MREINKTSDLYNIIKNKNRDINDIIIFNNNPTLHDVVDAWENDKIIIFNSAIENIYTADDFMKTVPDEWKSNIVLFFWPMPKDEFEKKILNILDDPKGACVNLKNKIEDCKQMNHIDFYNELKDKLEDKLVSIVFDDITDELKENINNTIIELLTSYNFKKEDIDVDISDYPVPNTNCLNVKIILQSYDIVEFGIFLKPSK